MVCEACNGTGFVNDPAGRPDVCNSCYGLGYVRGTYKPVPLSENKMKIRRAFIFTFLALAVYYGAFSYGFIRYSFGPITTLIILLIGHITAVSFLVFYILFRAVHDA